MKRIAVEDAIRITFKIENNEYKTWDGYIFPDARLISAEDATDDDWNLLDEYSEYVSIVGSEDDKNLEAFLVHYNDIHFACVENNVLYSGWGYRNPFSGDGLDDLGGEPRFIVSFDGEDIYLS